MTAPLVDVVIACHDVTRPLARAVSSVLQDAETRPIVRVTVVAHGVPGDELTVQLAGIEGSWRVVEFADGVRSAAGPFNHGLSMVEGEYCAVMGSDDFLEPGTMARWVREVRRHRPDMLMAAIRIDGFPVMPNPLVRLGRRRRLDAAKDRLFYRTAPLGLIRTATMRAMGLRMVEGVRVGEDFEFGIRIASLSGRVDVAAGAPCYVIGVDARERTTYARLTVTEALEPVVRLLDDGVFDALPPAHRRALAIKLARVTVLGCARTRPRPEDWDGDAEVAELSRLLHRLLAVAPRVLTPFNREERHILDVIRHTPTRDAVTAATKRMTGAGRVDRWFTPDMVHSFARESTLRRYVLYVLTRERKAGRPAARRRVRPPFGRGVVVRLRAMRPRPRRKSGPAAGRPTMLILSYSPIARDARLLKQVSRFTRSFDVTTCGYGPPPEGVVEHIRIPDDERYNDLDGKLITLKRYRQAYWRLSAVRWSRDHLLGRRFDVAIANDVEAVPVAVRLRPRHGVLADLHEYSPRLHDDNPAWFERITPWFEWVVRRYVTKADAWSTVSNGIVDEYEKNFGFRAELVTNAAPYQDFRPGPVRSPIRLVHSGACLRNRNLHVMAEAVDAAANDVTLDFYLTANDPPYLQELKESASRSARVTVHDPVPYAQLGETLAQYDVGIHVLPPVNFNNKLALPNKLFDYVQARLGVVIGPTAEMAYFVEQYGIGEVASDFTADGTRAAIERLTVESVRRFKNEADLHAHELAGERQVEVWERLIDGLMTRGPRR